MTNFVERKIRLPKSAYDKMLKLCLSIGHYSIDQYLFDDNVMFDARSKTTLIYEVFDDDMPKKILLTGKINDPDVIINDKVFFYKGYKISISLKTAGVKHEKSPLYQYTIEAVKAQCGGEVDRWKVTKCLYLAFSSVLRIARQIIDEHMEEIVYMGNYEYQGIEFAVFYDDNFVHEDKFKYSYQIFNIFGEDGIPLFIQYNDFLTSEDAYNSARRHIVEYLMTRTLDAVIEEDEDEFWNDESSSINQNDENDDEDNFWSLNGDSEDDDYEERHCF
jgi:hypothetical protein